MRQFTVRCFFSCDTNFPLTDFRIHLSPFVIFKLRVGLLERLCWRRRTSEPNGLQSWRLSGSKFTVYFAWFPRFPDACLHKNQIFEHVNAKISLWAPIFVIIFSTARNKKKARRVSAKFMRENIHFFVFLSSPHTPAESTFFYTRESTLCI